jgi:DNA-binding response OmpR family regulator
MNATSEKILLVINDPDVTDLVGRQALQPLGYQVKAVTDVNSAILQAVQLTPDLVIADLNLPGLSGKDLLVAFNSQGMQVPVIVLARQGEENDVIQAFRLGASDYLLSPVREAELVTAVERALKQVRDRRDRQRLDQQLKDTNQELKQRLHELTTIFAIGKAVISVTDQQVLFDKIVESMVDVAEADYGWLLLRHERSRTFLLTAHHNLPETWSRKMGQTLDDGISSLVGLSGESLAINGEPLKRFKVASLGHSAVVVPVKVQQEVIGLLVTVRKADRPVEKGTQSLLEAIADYASISLVNAHLFRALEDAAEQARSGEQKSLSQLEEIRQAVEADILPVTYPIDLLLTGKMGALTSEQEQALKTTQAALQKVLQRVISQRSDEAGKTPNTE